MNKILAEALGISPSSLSRYLNGSRTPPPSIISALSNLLSPDAFNPSVFHFPLFGFSISLHSSALDRDGVILGAKILDLILKYKQ